MGMDAWKRLKELGTSQKSLELIGPPWNRFGAAWKPWKGLEWRGRWNSILQKGFRNIAIYVLQNLEKPYFTCAIITQYYIFKPLFECAPRLY